MKLKELLIEYELKKNPTFEKEIKNRSKKLETKIKSLKNKKEEELRKIENKTDDLILGKNAEMSDDIKNFIDFSADKIREYEKEFTEINIPKTLIPSLAGAIIGEYSYTITKNISKIIDKLVKKEKPKDLAEFEKIINLPFEDMVEKIGNEIPGLDVEDLEEFVNKISKDKKMKEKIQELNRRISRLSAKYAENKYLSNIESGEKIRL
jgi:hypothetical protein